MAEQASSLGHQVSLVPQRFRVAINAGVSLRGLPDRHFREVGQTIGEVVGAVHPQGVVRVRVIDDAPRPNVRCLQRLSVLGVAGRVDQDTRGAGESLRQNLRPDIEAPIVELGPELQQDGHDRGRVGLGVSVE